MSPKIAALILLGAALVLPQTAAAQSAMCAEPDFAAAFERAEHEAASPLPLHDEDLPWCASPEDPRCAPRDGQSAPITLGVRQAVAVTIDAPATPSVGLAGANFTPHTGAVPCAGVSSRIERPPR